MYLTFYRRVNFYLFFFFSITLSKINGEKFLREKCYKKKPHKITTMNNDAFRRKIVKYEKFSGALLTSKLKYLNKRIVKMIIIYKRSYRDREPRVEARKVINFERSSRGEIRFITRETSTKSERT